MARTEICDFWIGNFDCSNNYFDFIGEDPEFYEDETDEKYVSKFAKSQGERWIDHDFMESGFEDGNDSFIEKFRKYSYSYEWIPFIASKEGNDLESVNTVVFITKGRIQNPTSVSGPGYALRYIGQIEYKI